MAPIARDEDGIVEIRWDEALLARYEAIPSASKPGFDVVALPNQAGGPAGKNLIVAAPHDHVWHAGLFFCQKVVDGLNCWESERNDAEGRPYGYAEYDRYAVDDADDHVRVDQTVIWTSDAGEELLRDDRTIRTYAPTGDGYHMTWEVKLTAVGETRRLSSETLHGHYSGLSARFARSMTGGRVLLPDGIDPGETTSPRAASGPAARWCDYSGRLDGKRGTGDPWTAGIAMFDHPDNDPHPVNWFVMTEPFGFLSANPTWRTVRTLAADESQTWRWGVWVHAGTPTERRIEEAYREFTRLPTDASRRGTDGRPGG